MSHREDEPTDLFDAVCRLDDIAEWLSESWPDEAQRLRALSTNLKDYVVISLPSQQLPRDDDEPDDKCEGCNSILPSDQPAHVTADDIRLCDECWRELVAASTPAEPLSPPGPPEPEPHP